MAPLRQLELVDALLMGRWTFVAWRQRNDKHHLTPLPTDSSHASVILYLCTSPLLLGLFSPALSIPPTLTVDSAELLAIRQVY